MVKETIVDEQFIESMNVFRERSSPNQSLLEACSENIVIFSEKMLGFRLRSWQVDFLRRVKAAVDGDYFTKEFAVMTSRQIGKSAAVSIFCLWCAIFNKYPGRGNTFGNTVIGIVSASDEQAKKLLLEMKKFLRIGDQVMLDKYGDVYPSKFFTRLVDDTEQNNMSTLTFKKYDANKHGAFLLKDSKVGSVINSYPPTTVVLGKTFSVEIIDEAGMSDRIDDVFYKEYMYPTGNFLDAIRIRLSTPWQSSGFFYRLMDPDDLHGGSPADRLVFTIDAIRIEAPDYYAGVMKTIDRERLDGNLDEVNRAYYCKFVKGEASYFDPMKVIDAFTKDYGMVDAYGSHCDLGIDFGGQVSSRTVITISTIDEKGKIKRLYHRAYPVGEDLSLLDDIADLLTRFNVQRIIPDDCPAGDFIIKIMREKGWDIHPMNFKSDKIKKYGAFRSALNRGDVQSYDDDELKIEMLALEYEHGKVNSMIHHAAGEKDDLIDSWVMSCYFYVVEDGNFRFFDVDEAPDGYDPFLN